VTRPTINAGIYVLDPKIFRDIPANTPWMFEKDVFPKLLMKGEPVFGYTSERFWIDIGNAQKYRLAHEAILRGEVAVRVFGTRESGGYWVGKKAEIAKSARIFGKILIGEKAEVQEEAVIKDYAVLGDGVRVGKGAIIDNSILWEGVVVGARARVSHSIIGFNCRIEDSCVIDGAVLADNTVVTKGSVINA
jgi:mannose-1-phosphate guanylyltransferase/phosphomannomutase